jgi:serine protease Do
MQGILQQLSDEMAEAAAGLRRSLVQITDGRGSIGAGTIWHADGLVITNAHVVSGRDRRGMIQVRRMSVVLHDERELPAQVLAVDTENDLAALAVDAVNLPVITPGDSRSLRPGQWVMAIGHPWGVRDGLTAGVVIGAGGNLPEMPPGREWIALNLQLRPGHSGGPLVDTAGRLVGINTMITGPEVGFAIPSHVVKGFLKESLGSQVASAAII